MTAVDTNKKARISLPTEAMTRVKSVSGGVSFHCGDKVAEHLAGLPLEHVKGIAATMGLDHGKYDHLNVGQQRMNIGNLIRTKVRKSEDDAAVFADAARGVRESFEAETASAREAKAASDAEKAANKEAIAKAKEEAKTAKDAAKAAKLEDAEKLKAEKQAAREAAKAERESAKQEKAAEREASKQAKAAEREAAKNAVKQEAAQ